MLLYALRRLIYLVPVAFGVSLLVFALVHLAPGDPISAIVPPDAPKEVVDKLKGFVQAQSWFQDMTPIVVAGPTN